MAEWKNQRAELPCQIFLLILCVLKLIPLGIFLSQIHRRCHEGFFNHSCSTVLLQTLLTWQLTSFLTGDSYIWVEQSTWNMLSSALEGGWAKKELVGPCEMQSRLQAPCISPAQTVSWLIEPARSNKQGSPPNVWCTWFAQDVTKALAQRCLWALAQNLRYSSSSAHPGPGVCSHAHMALSLISSALDTQLGGSCSKKQIFLGGSSWSQCGSIQWALSHLNFSIISPTPAPMSWTVKSDLILKTRNTV